MAPKNNERFAQIVGEAFSALGVTQLEFQHRGGPSDTTLRKILDADPVGLSTRTLTGLDRAFGWTPGSAARTLAGGDPTPMSREADAFLSKIRHPSLAGSVDTNDQGLVAALDEVLETGQTSPATRAQLERLRDETAIRNFPEAYASLSRDGKLKVAEYCYSIQREELYHRLGMGGAVGGAAQAGLPNDTEAGASLFDALPLTSDSGSDAVDNAEHRGDVADGQ